MPKKIIWNQWIAKQTEENSIDLEMPNGEVFNIPPPALWSKAVTEASRKEQPDPDEIGRAMLGEDGFARFEKAGGSAMALSALVQENNKASLPE